MLFQGVLADDEAEEVEAPDVLATADASSDSTLRLLYGAEELIVFCHPVLS